MKLEHLNKINYRLLADAVDFYCINGFKYIELPWVVPENITKITFQGDTRFKTGLGDLLGSGEQGFLYLDYIGQLNPGRYMSVTPCFRDEREDYLHQKQFIKLELYITKNVCIEELHRTIDLCREFLASKTENVIQRLQFSDKTFDLMCNDIELGSYGIREHEHLRWIYGTGLAEPRYSFVTNYSDLERK